MTTINYGTKNFTIDLWYYRVGSNGHSLSYHGGGAAFNNTAFILAIDLSNKVRFILSNGSSAICDITTTATVPTGSWTHIAVVRNGGAVNVYVNGISSASASIGSASVTNSINDAYVIGARGNTIDFTMNGYVDEYRHSVDIARWTANFTPPSQPYG